MTVFRRRLAECNSTPEGRRWIFVPYDQLNDRIGPLSREEPASTGIVLVESRWKASRRPYHKQKLALVLANLRHFAIEQARRGVAVRHVVTDGPYGESLRKVAAELGGSLRVMTPAERELRVDLQPLIREGVLEEIPHEGWLTTREQFAKSQKGETFRMNAFYRAVRRETGILMQDGKPLGGKFSFDADNRQPWSGDPEAARPPMFEVDPIKAEVAELVEIRYASNPGRLDPDALPASATDAKKLWGWAKTECLPYFGPYEDAMSTRSTTLFHSRISGLLNLHRLLPREVVGEVVDLDLPLASKEGFVRQVLGWREFVRHVHLATDGFRSLDAQGSPSFLGSRSPLPPAFWGKRSGLACLDHVVRNVWDEGYGHHITRLMVLCNLATLLDVSPRELTDWFWAAYTDAFDWVVEPNVLGMGTFAVGDLMTTKPYVSGAAYIDRMSDYCSTCAFDPRRNCPITSMYWAFLDRHEPALRTNPRLRMPLASLRRRDAARRRKDREVFESTRRRLGEGLPVMPPP